MKILIRMKRYSIIMMSILFMLISCAEEGPYKMGQLEFSIKCDMIAPTSAIVSVKIPQNNENLLNDIDFVYIADKPLNNYETITESDIIKPSEKIGYNSATEEYAYFFNRLWPNTTYYVLIKSDIQYDYDPDWSYTIYYYPAFSFTTKKEGDDSELKDYIKDYILDNTKLVLEQYVYHNTTTLIGINTPENYYFEGYFYASTSHNFENAVISDYFSSSTNITYIRFNPILEREKYYFKFEGNISTRLGNVVNVSIQFPDTIDLTNVLF